jgi:S-adenosylmethionine:tRNA ribosyltransferase-isomerase
MTAVMDVRPLEFTLDAAREAHEPPEARGLPRDGVRLLVSRGDAEPADTRFDRLPELLEPGDLLVVNTSATVPGALDGRLPDGQPIVVHLSGELPGGVWLVEVREPRDGSTAPLLVPAPTVIELLAAGHVRLLERFSGSRRLWLASFDPELDVLEHTARFGRPIRYRHVPRDWPIDCYQTVFSREPGSVEMPSASRPISKQVLSDLVTRGIALAPLVLHTGVSSLEGGEQPYPERFRVPLATADAVNTARARGSRVVAAGTTVVRAMATVTDEHGGLHPGAGWTEVIVTPAHPVLSVDGLLTGWHEPESSHLMMLEAFAGRPALERAYATALEHGYLWHEFGDSHLILPREDVEQA